MTWSCAKCKRVVATGNIQRSHSIKPHLRASNHFNNFYFYKPIAEPKISVLHILLQDFSQHFRTLRNCFSSRFSAMAGSWRARGSLIVLAIVFFGNVFRFRWLRSGFFFFWCLDLACFVLGDCSVEMLSMIVICFTEMAGVCYGVVVIDRGVFFFFFLAFVDFVDFRRGNGGYMDLFTFFFW